MEAWSHSPHRCKSTSLEWEHMRAIRGCALGEDTDRREICSVYLNSILSVYERLDNFVQDFFGASAFDEH